jgi:hypothetical protein
MRQRRAGREPKRSAEWLRLRAECDAMAAYRRGEPYSPPARADYLV